jgi:hypothetical protein
MLVALMLLLGNVGHAGQAEAKAAYMRGAALEKNKQYDQAITEYKASLAADSHYVYAHKGLGNCYYYKGDKAKAVEHYDAYLAVMPNDAGIKKFADSLRGSEASAPAGSDKVGSDGVIAKPEGKTNIIYTDPVSDALGTINLGYSRAFGPHNALIVEGAFISLGLGSSSYTMTGGGLGWHFTARQLEGWFIGPKLQYFVVNASSSSTTAAGTVKVEAKGTAISYGAEAGYQWLWDSGFMLNLGFGGAMTNINVDASATAGSSSATGSLSFSGFLPTALFNLGYAF